MTCQYTDKFSLPFIYIFKTGVGGGGAGGGG
jgi:2-oxo-4-hydroxy-4-carboxy--5-ureidoimidazoline (OHCU) decarboxylase